jgi:hypothetical protein
MGEETYGKLWLRWVGANIVAETLGLGASFLVLYLTFSLGEPRGLLQAAALALPSIVIGGIEGLLVGLGQWWAMHPYLPSVPRNRWVLATVIGALLAWTLGMLPSTLMSVSAQAEGAAQAAAANAEPPTWIVILLSMCLGLVAGIILATPQWLVLRHSLAHAGWWIPANCLAWMLAMPLTFILPDLLPAGSSVVTIAIFLLAALALVGAIVGAVHGAALVWLLHREPVSPASAQRMDLA